MSSPFQIEPAEHDSIQQRITQYLQKEQSIVFAYLHGSFQSNCFRDIDIGIYLKKRLTKAQTVRYELALESQLQTLLSYPVDVRVLNHAPVSFRFHVIQKGIVLFSKNEDQRVEFECRTLSAYHDFATHRKTFMREALGLHL